MSSKCKLSVCIPNYNRIDKLEKLIQVMAQQIMRFHLEEYIEICVSDDCSPINPDVVIKELQTKYPAVFIHYRRNDQNMGMDYNFLNSVMMAQGEYAWIIGNDDLPTNNALQIFMNVVESDRYKNVDFIVTPFDCYDYSEHLRGTTYPFGTDMESILFNTKDKEQLNRLVMSVQRNGALFDFLSNVIFKREHWIQHGNLFSDKMNTLFIQMYMNMQTILDGASYLYTPDKIINDYIDDDTNETFDRTYRIVIGLYDVFSYFWQGEERKHLESKVLDIFIQSFLFEMDIHDEKRIKLCQCDEGKIRALDHYYIIKDKRREFFTDCSAVIYGAGNNGLLALEQLHEFGVEVIGFCDSDINKQGNTNRGIEIFSYENLKKLCTDNPNIVVVVTSHLYMSEIVQQLENDRINNIAIIT